MNSEWRDGRPRPSPFTLAPARIARYTLVRDLGPFFSSRLDRLDARPSLHTHVPDALLRRLAGRRCPQHSFSQIIATSRHAARTTFSLSRQHHLRARHVQTHSQEPGPRRNHPHHASPRRRNLCLRTSLPPAGISHRLGMGAVVRLTSRGRPEYHRTFHDSDGVTLRRHANRVPESRWFL